MTSIGDQLNRADTNAARATLRAEAMKATVDAAVASALTAGREWEFVLRDGRTVTVSAVQIGAMRVDAMTQVPTFTRRRDSGADPLWFKVAIDGKYLNGDGLYGFVNPPLMVPDGTTSEEVDPGTGRTRRRPNFKEDPLGAAKAIIAQAVGGEL